MSDLIAGETRNRRCCTPHRQESPLNDSATESLAAALGADDPFVILTGYLDESGTHGSSPIMTMGGYIAEPRSWGDFDRRWRKLLAEKGLTHLHTRKLLTRKGEFGRWAYPTFAQFMERMQDLTDTHLLCGFSVSVKPAEFDKIYAAEAPKGVALDSQYGLCFRSVVMELGAMLIRTYRNEVPSLYFVLESGHPNSGAGRTIVTHLKRFGPPHLRPMLRAVSYGDKREFPGLQVADAIGHVAYKVEGVADHPLHTSAEPVTENYTVRSPGRRCPLFKYHLGPENLANLRAIAVAAAERRREWGQLRHAPRAPDNDTGGE